MKDNVWNYLEDKEQEEKENTEEKEETEEKEVTEEKEELKFEKVPLSPLKRLKLHIDKDIKHTNKLYNS